MFPQCCQKRRGRVNSYLNEYILPNIMTRNCTESSQRLRNWQSIIISKMLSEFDKCSNTGSQIWQNIANSHKKRDPCVLSPSQTDVNCSQQALFRRPHSVKTREDAAQGTLEGNQRSRSNVWETLKRKFAPKFGAASRSEWGGHSSAQMGKTQTNCICFFFWQPGTNMNLFWCSLRPTGIVFGTAWG